MRTLNLNIELDYAAAPGLLFKATVVRVKSAGTAGLICNAQYSAYDALSLPLFHEDVDKLLADGLDTHLPQRTPFEHFADTYYLQWL